MKSNLDQWAGQLKAQAEILSELILTSELTYDDKRLITSISLSIECGAKAMRELVARNEA